MAQFPGARMYVYARNLGTVLCVNGEIDASNADDLKQAIRRFARLKTPLILDLSHLDFLSIAGFRALLVLNNEHQKARVHCSVVTGPALRRLTRLVNDHGLQVSDSVPEALQLIEDIVQARRQLLSDMSRQRRPQRRIAAVPS
ncbi:MAG: STAS domain-containing protein [Mycobacterium sp.]